MQEELSLFELRQLLTDDERFNLNQLLRMNGRRSIQHVRFKHLPD